MNNDNKKNSVKEYMSKKDPFYNWIIRAVIAIALVVVIIVSSVTVMGKINEDRRLYEELVGVNEGRIYEQNGGEGVKDNVFEAESALYSGTISDENGDIGHACAAYSHIVNEKFSGGIALRGVGTPKNASAPNTFTFRFVSDKKVRITMTARVGASEAQTSFSELYTVSVNGNAPKNHKDITIPARSDPSVTAVGGYYMADVDMVVDLSPGENTIVVQTAKNNACVFDSLNLKTSAALTDYAPHYWLNDVVSLTKAPTEYESGEITLSDEHCTATYSVPAVMEGLSTGAYSSVKNADTVQVKLGTSDFVLITESAQPYTLTVDSEYVRFGDSFSTNVTVFDKMPEVTFNAPENYEFYGWYEKGAADNVYGENDFIMPNRDITLVPVFEDYDYAETMSDELQKVRLLPESMDGTTPIREDKGNGFDQRKLRDGITKAAITTDDRAEVATVYNYGRVEKGWSFMTMNACDYAVSGTKSLVFYMRNMGNSPISFTVYQTSSSSDPTAVNNPRKSVTLEAGESARFILMFSFVNNNLLSYFEFNEAADELRLACVQYIVKGIYTFPGEPTLTYTATLNGDALFSGGFKTAQVAVGGKLPDIVLTGENAGEGKRISGFVVDNGAEKRFTVADDFVMPETNVTLTPYVTLDWDYSVSGGNGVLDFSEEKTVKREDGQSFDMSYISNITVDSVSRTGRYAMRGDEIGTEYTFTGEVGDYFRLMRAYTMNGEKRAITYKFVNSGTSDISFTAYQVNSGVVTDGAPSEKVTLAPGEEKTVTLTFAYSNKNLMCLVVLDEAATDAVLWMSAEITTDVGNAHSVTLVGDVTFADGGTTAQVNAGAKLPDIVLTGENGGTDKKLNGWILSDGQTESYVSADDFVMPETDITLMPYVTLGWDYSVSGGSGVLDFSEQRTITLEDGQIYNMSQITPVTVDKVSRTGRYVLDKGEVGTEYTFTGDADEYFRLMRAYVVGGTPRTVTYKFRNNGTSGIAFTAYQVNSGASTAGAPSGKVTLAPGEETTVTLTFSYSNKNIMCLIVLDEAATDAVLWMSAEITVDQA